MKICPRCRKTYTDENLNFCLDDGSVLEQATASPLPETVLINQPRATAPTQPQITNQPFPTQQPAQAGWNTGQPQYATQPKKSSKTWVWVLLILGFLALVCGGGFVAFIFWAASQTDQVASNSPTNTSSGNKGSATPSTTKSASTNSSSTTVTTNSSTDDRKNVEKVDLSEWVRDFSAYGNTAFTDGEFLMSSKQKGFYYVVAAPADTYQTENATTSITLRNVDKSDSRLGYGLVFHSNPTPLQQGYAFLLDTKKQKYRVVHHSPQKEDSVVSWTKSDAIKEGSQDNTLEVRDLTDKIELYINGQMVTSIKNVYGYPGGVVGLYTGDATKVAFKNLEIRK